MSFLMFLPICHIIIILHKKFYKPFTSYETLMKNGPVELVIIVCLEGYKDLFLFLKYYNFEIQVLFQQC